MSGEYCYSWDGECYYGEFNTEKEALEGARKDRPDAENVYIGTCEEPELRWSSCEEDIIESIIDNLGEDVGEAAKSFEISTEDELELARLIDETVKGWIDVNKIKPSCYAVLDGHEVPLTDTD